MQDTNSDSLRGHVTEQEVNEIFKERPASVRRIGVFLFHRFGNVIDMSDVISSSKTKRQTKIEMLLSRSLAAHMVSVATDVEPEKAAASVVDGGQDLGIDAIALDRNRKICVLVQSWFNFNGRGDVAQVDVLKFLEGFNLIVSDGFSSRANAKILAMESELRAAISDVGWRFKLIFVSTSATPISPQFESDIQARLDYHDPGNYGTFTFENYSLNRVTKSVEKAFDPSDINIEICLGHWGHVEKPVEAYYGQVPLADIIKWKEHGARLFEKNLRNFDPSSPVSESIRQTIGGESSEFWYRNNGATMLCKKIERRGPYQLTESRVKETFFVLA